MQWIDFPIFNSTNFLSEFKANEISAGILLVNKPLGWTSFDVVKYVRSRIQKKKVGHAGTLDPMADGLLVLCFGKATKSIDQIQSLTKEYNAKIKLGGSTPSYDAETQVDQQAAYDHITLEDIEQKLLSEFSGDIQQIPPMYSALKRNGKKLYELARIGKSVDLESRLVHVYSTDIHSFTGNTLELTINCSKGTYIRSIAHDLGIALGSRAHLCGLTRNKIGDLEAKQALEISVFDSLFKQ
tara:strand:- start:1132 stop:1854 length:723 start_codon:yes stop_codon:yes gene_type:complete